MTRFEPWLLAAALAFASASAHADGKEDAKTLFAEGRKLRAKGDCAAALDSFRKALVAYPDGLGSLRNIAECEQELGQFASARRSWWELRGHVKRLQKPEYQGWDTEAETAHHRLGPKTPRLTVVLEGVRLGDVTVTINGETVAPPLVGTELERDPGEHKIEAFRRKGQASATRTIALREGEKDTVHLVAPAPMPGDEEVPPKQPPDGDGPAPAKGGLSGMQVGGIVSLAVGGLAAIGAGVAIGIRQSALGDLEDACPDLEAGSCPADEEDAAQAAIDRGRTAEVLIGVFAATAAAGVGLGTTLLIVGSQDEGASVGLQADPWGGRAMLGVSGRFR